MKSILPQGLEKYAAEFIGTYILVFSIGCNVVAGSRIWFPLSIACTLMVAVYMFASVSGANFNPAVSIVLGLTRKMEWKEVARYCGVQILAGILAGLSYSLVLWDVVALQPAKGYSWWQAGIAETLYTCMLCFVVLHVSGDVPEYFGLATNGGMISGRKNGAAGNQYFGLAIGFVLMAAIPSGGHISGGCFNPAVAIGIDLSSILLGFYWWIPYAAFEIVGALLAALLFRMTDPLTNLDDRGEPSYRIKLISELIGTFFLVLTVGLNVIGRSNAPVYSIAASLMCMIYALGRVSGGHFNPAVTLAILARGGDLIKPAQAMAYWGMQFAGGFLGAVVYTFLEWGESFPLKVGSGFTLVNAFFAEAMFTFLLCYVVLAVATTSTAKSQFFGLAIASVVTAGGIAIGVISGGVLNPAVAFSVATTSALAGGSLLNFIPYALSELLGGALAAAVFRITRPSEYALKG
jgi:aquaporin Z